MVYSELLAYLGVMLPGRDDYQVMVPAVLPMAEQRMYRGELNTEPLRVAIMLKTVSLLTGARPADFLSAKKVSTTAAGFPTEVPLDYRPLDKLPQESRAFSWDGATMVLSPDCTFPVTLRYYAKADALNPAVPTSTNVLLTEAPNVYAQAILVELAQAWRDDALGARSAANWSSAQNIYIEQDKRAQYSGSILTAGVRK